MKRLINIVLLLFIVVGLFIPIATPVCADSVDLYWIGGTGNWSDTAHWSTSSGGSGGHAVPTLTNDVYFDANSFSVGSATVTIDNDVRHCNSMDWTGATDSPTLTGANLYVHGDLTMVSTMTFDVGLGSWDTEITTNGAAIASITVLGSTVLLDDVTTIEIDVYGGGTLDFNGFNVTCSEIYLDWSELTQPILYMGSGTINVDYRIENNNGLIEGETSTISISDTSIQIQTRGVGESNYNDVNIKCTSSTPSVEEYYIALIGDMSFNTLTIDSSDDPQIVIVSDGSVITVTDIVAVGTSGKEITIASLDSDLWELGGQFTLSVASGDVECDYLDLSGSVATGGATFYAGTNSVDSGGNENWIFGDGEVNVYTNPATNIQTNTAKLNGEITDLGGFSTAYAYFEYDTDGSFSDPETTSEQAITAIGEFSHTIVGLVSEDTYYFRACARYDTSSYSYGSSRSFTTIVTGDTSGEISFTTLDGVGDVTNFTGTPSKNSISLSWNKAIGADYTVIRYLTNTYPVSITDGVEIYNNTGTNYEHTGLEEGKTYYYSAWGYSGTEYSANAETLSLTTLGIDSEISGGDSFPVPQLPLSFLQDPDASGLYRLEPFYSAVNNFAISWDMPEATMWLIIVLLTIMFICFVVLLRSRNLMASVITMCILMMAAVGLHLLSAWFILVVISVALGSWALSRESG